MAVNATTDNPAASVFAALNGSGTAASTSKLNDTESRFLKLLTTQLKNQDPLNPMDNAEMTSQLAQINMVDGIGKLNTTMQTLLSSISGAQTMQAASLVGHGVLVPGASLQLSGSKSVGGFTLSGPADAVTATIKDGNGLTVRTLDLGSAAAGTHTFAWDGTSDGGAIAADGSYTVSFEATQGKNKVTAAALTLGVVSSVTSGGSGLNLNVGGLGSFAMSDVKQIF